MFITSTFLNLKDLEIALALVLMIFTDIFDLGNELLMKKEGCHYNLPSPLLKTLSWQFYCLRAFDDS